MNTEPCECRDWCRSDAVRFVGKTPMATNHHPNCARYNDSLMDVWRVTVDGISCYVDSEKDALGTAGTDDGAAASVTKERMHRELFEQLPEFDGF